MEETLMQTAAKMKIENSNTEDCILVEASKLSLTDTFMSYEPKIKSEEEFKETLTEVIKNGIRDFYRPAMDPSFLDSENTKIHYKAGEKPAVGKSYNWWEETVKDSKWCFGTKAQYVAFIGILIKRLVAKGWTYCEAWHAVCNDSKNLGHYSNSDNAKNQLEETGSREIYGFSDLANTYKILAKDEEAGGFWFVSGGYVFNSCYFPLAELGLSNSYKNNHDGGVAWLVLNK